jgi:alpha-tubulin suppressor-like RCC1 family protein
MVSSMANSVVGWGRQVLPSAQEMAGLMDVSAGQAFNLGLRSDGTVVAWGSNNYLEATIPEGLSEVTAIAAGSTHALALRQNGTVVAWGDDREEQATPPPGLGQVKMIGAGQAHSLALKANGQVVAWGSNRFAQAEVPPGLDQVAAISVGSFHNLALRRDGTVVAWGRNDDGESSVPEALVDVVAIAAGGSHSLALRSDGTLVAWGNNDFGQASSPRDQGHILRISAGEDHSLALRDNGDVLVWGRNHYGQTDLPVGLANGRRITAGHHHNVILRPDGTTVAWGRNEAGQTLSPRDLSEVSSVSAWEGHTVALRQDGTVFWWGGSWAAGIEPNPDELGTVVAVAAGRAHALALRADGTVLGWGDNLYGQARPPRGLTDVVAIAAGEFHSLALREDGTVAAWGNNFHGQTRLPPGLGKVVSIAAGQEHSMALTQGGMIFSWGNNFHRQREVPDELKEAVSIVSGSYHNLALRRNGTGTAWGSDIFGQSTLPPGLSDLVAVSASRSHSVGIRSNRTAVAWGGNHYGQSTVPEHIDQILQAAAGGGRTLLVRGEVQPPRLVRQFQSKQLSAGDALFLLPATAGTPPFRYQWMKKGRPIEGADGPALALAAAGAQDSGTYSLIIANQAGSTSSHSFSIDVQDPAVTVASTPRVAVLGEPARFTARARGTAPFSYQWFKDGQAIPAAEESSLVLDRVQEEDAGVYTVEVGSAGNSTRSEPITFHIQPRILTPLPENLAARIGERMVLQVQASGSRPLAVQWFHDGTPIEGGTEETLVLDNVGLGNSGIYSVTVANPAGRVTSGDTRLGLVPHLFLQPYSQAFSEFGGTAIFEVRATGTPPLTYHWYKNGRPVAETRDPRLVLEQIRSDDAGEYHVVVSNPVGRVESEKVTLMVPPEIKIHPRSQTVQAGTRVILGVRALGAQPFTYQWQKDGQPIEEAKRSQLSLPDVTGADTGRYSVMVSNDYGRATSQAATLSISPSIIRQPTATIHAGSREIVLTVEAEGSLPISYQWVKDGVVLPRATGPQLRLVGPEAAGSYSVILSNAVGILVSDTIEVAEEKE